MTTGSGDERFAFGIDTFIAGLAARAGKAPRSPAHWAQQEFP